MGTSSHIRSAVRTACLLSLMLPVDAFTQERVFLTREQALARALQEAPVIREQTVRIGQDEAGELAEALGIVVLEREYIFYEAVHDREVTRRAVIMNVPGQYQPITFIVGIRPDGTVEHVEIMVYRESRGSEVRRSAFLKQYRGKSMSDPLKLRGDIMAITGATISSRAVTGGVRLALILHERLLRDGTGGRPPE